MAPRRFGVADDRTYRGGRRRGRWRSRCRGAEHPGRCRQRTRCALARPTGRSARTLSRTVGGRRSSRSCAPPGCPPRSARPGAKRQGGVSHRRPGAFARARTRACILAVAGGDPGGHGFPAWAGARTLPARPPSWRDAPAPAGDRGSLRIGQTSAADAAAQAVGAGGRTRRPARYAQGGGAPGVRSGRSGGGSQPPMADISTLGVCTGRAVRAVRSTE